MQIDCRNLDCPKPVINTKEALNSLEIGENLEILLNKAVSLENVLKFIKSNNLKPTLITNDGEFIVNVVKTSELTDQDASKYGCEIVKKKVVFLKDDKVGSEPIGKGLLAKFLGSIASVEPASRPSYIICVNDAVLMTTNRAHPSYAALKELEMMGVKILSCGSCLEALGIVDRLGIGEASNAFEIINLLLNNETVCL
ncbi:selenium metabolism protein [Campylobacter iguaniorum]|uniref:sulfurtransferase-like selenium metabolism protein YedF n=1 Tax=Campylobacter iguaniorum TaxID=1244531 RepID=UPI0007C9132D|nr:sulfurtransferase-like selenium metabolism protein YedF [Campylobacter iguaniorum]ANE35386.1 selenium metabolism protein [Campylobacter iguaniorum]